METEIYSFEFDNNDKDSMNSFQNLMDFLADEMNQEIEKLANELGISIDCASSILYLRSRSRWTQENEDMLISLDKSDQPLPNVYSGEL